MRQTDLFEDCYNCHESFNKLTGPATYTDHGKFPELPPVTTMFFEPVETDTQDDDWSPTSDWSIDKDYYYIVHDEVIRVCVDFEKVLHEVGHNNVLNLLYDGEAEIRVRKKFDILKTLDHIEIVKECWEEDVEDDYGVNRAIKKWLPKELHSFVKLRTYFFAIEDTPYSHKLASYYKEVYAEHGVKPIKAWGNTWINQDLHKPE